ncbi:MAG: FtsX-like permease family protein [bacterium]|nr:FtsX-like permease family protein [bacterium]
MLHDLLLSIRVLIRRPSYPIAATAIMTLGLSVSIAVFVYVNGFYQPFPGVQDDGLVRVFGFAEDEPYQDVSYLDYVDYSAANGAFEEMAATQPFYAASVRLETMTEVAFLEAVSGSYFSVLGIRTSVGRGLVVEDDQPGADPAAVISHAWWQRSFAGDETVVGRTIYLNFRPFTVVGVASPDFLGTVSGSRPDVWIPFAPFRDRYKGWDAAAQNREAPLVRVYGRLSPGERRERGQSELASIAEGLDETYPRQTGPRRVRLEAATWIDPSSRLAETPTVRLMMLTAGLLLLLACANVANLLLSMGLGRQREICLRSALGASPARLLGQTLTENIILSGLAGGISLALAAPLSARLGSYFARPSVWGANVSREAAIDWRVVLFALGVSLLTGLVAGFLPALRSSRRNLATTLRADAEMAAGLPRRLWKWSLPGVHGTLVAAQVVLSVVLLVVAGLVVRTLVFVGDLHPGFSYEHLMVTHISTSSTTLEPGERDHFFRELTRQLSEEPWVQAATVADYPLLSGHRSAELRLDGQSEPVPLVYSKVIPGFFEALGIDVLRGRAFVEEDETDSRDVAIVNELLARRYFGDADAVGRRLWWPGMDGAEDRIFEIVGVVEDTKTQDYLTEPEPTVYFSYPQHSYPTGSALLVSTRGNPAEAVPVLHRWLRDYEAHLAIINVVTYPEIVRGFLYTHRMSAEMFSALAVLGLLLAAVGIFSVTALTVSRKTKEIGVRMSIGARRIDIGLLIVRRALVPVGFGLGIGIAISLGVTRLVRSLLQGVEPNDPLTLIIGGGVLVAASALAAFMPARRATSVDPVTALRSE